MTTEAPRLTVEETPRLRRNVINVIIMFTVVYSSLDGTGEKPPVNVINKAHTIPSFCIKSESCTVAGTILQLLEMMYKDKNITFFIMFCLKLRHFFFII